MPSGARLRGGGGVRGAVDRRVHPLFRRGKAHSLFMGGHGEVDRRSLHPLFWSGEGKTDGGSGTRKRSGS